MNLEQKTITSMEVAEMVNKEHSNLLKDIRRYVEQSAEVKINLGEFFKESTYLDANNQKRPCFNVTIKGCEFIANKLTGSKGIEFTAKYVNKFHDMKEAIQTGLLDNLSTEMKALIMHDKKIQFVIEHMEDAEQKLSDVDQDLQTFKKDMPLLGLECDRITTAIKIKGVNCLGGKDSAAYMDKSLRGKVYSDIHHQIKREFGVSTYKAIKRSQTDIVLSIISNYSLPLALQEEIENANSQICL